MAIDITNQYVQELLRDLKLENESEEEQAKALQMLSDRFDRVVVYTVLEHLTEEQKKQFAAALSDPERVEEVIENVTADVPGLSQALEQALVNEYQALKSAMQA